MSYCFHCDRFDSLHTLKDHYLKSPLHHYCPRCDQHFTDGGDLRYHLYCNHDYCQHCRLLFKNARGLEEHYRQSPAHLDSNIGSHFCSLCNKYFQSENNLRQHLQSGTHSQKLVPFRGVGCRMTFVSVSAMMRHLESGSCVSGMTRQRVDARVRELDTRHFITCPDRLITGSSPDTKYYATELSWNGFAFECYFCHRSFRTLTALNQHLASPTHQEKRYVCPLKACGMAFTTLSGLCAHVESEKCGVKRFKDVNAVPENIANTFTLRLAL